MSKIRFNNETVFTFHENGFIISEELAIERWGETMAKKYKQAVKEHIAFQNALEKELE